MGKNAENLLDRFLLFSFVVWSRFVAEVGSMTVSDLWRQHEHYNA